MVFEQKGAKFAKPRLGVMRWVVFLGGCASLCFGTLVVGRASSFAGAMAELEDLWSVRELWLGVGRGSGAS